MFGLLRRRERPTRGSQRIFALPSPAADDVGEAASSFVSMRTVGLDLSAAKSRTATAAIEWGRREATVAKPARGLDDEELLRRLAAADWVGIDAPFGWPQAMVEAIHAYATEGEWPAPDKEGFRYRRTDLVAHEVVLAETGEKLWPLSVSSDRLALTAWRSAQLRERAFEGSGLRFDRAGADRILEVYPSAALLLWGLRGNGYKTSRDPERRAAEGDARATLLAALEAQAPWLRWAPGAREACADSDDALDAVLAALIARAGALGLTAKPGVDDLELARREGWTHLPAKGSLPKLLGS
jgi:predicted nuclease with RNAse H fold